MKSVSRQEQSQSHIFQKARGAQGFNGAFFPVIRAVHNATASYLNIFDFSCQQGGFSLSIATAMDSSRVFTCRNSFDFRVGPDVVVALVGMSLVGSSPFPFKKTLFTCCLQCGEFKVQRQKRVPVA